MFLTCYTGIACTQYGGLNATTLHKFAGLGDGRYSDDELLNLIKTDERYIKTKINISTADVLIIDEVSMVSAKLFRQVELVCREVRCKETHFGSLQVILCGDFFQLPPIRDELYGDFGHYCFESEFFCDAFPHSIQMCNVHRQSETELIRAINQLECGDVSEDTEIFMKCLSRPISAEHIVKLYARNLEVDIYNFEQLRHINSALKTFLAKDTGDIFYLKKILAPKHFGVKVSAPVMLLANLSDTLVNGLIGKVDAIEENVVHVEFSVQGKQELVHVERYKFTKFDPITKTCVASRLQFPLKLAFAITIHKSQGMSIPYVEIDCKFVNQPGQIGVAVGRAQTIDGLCVKNFKKSCCKRHPEKVYKFCSALEVGQLDDSLLCCRNKNNNVELKDYGDICNFEMDSDVCELELSETLIDQFHSFI